MSELRTSAVGTRRPRLDSAAIVQGALRYGADRWWPELLYARPVLSPIAHGRIEHIDATGALATPGCTAVLTAADLPTAPGGMRMHEPLAREEILFAGQPVALALAETPTAAEEASERVVLSLKALEPVLDLELAAAPDAPLARTTTAGGEHGDMSLHAGVGASDASADMEGLSGNVTARTVHADGDAAAMLQGCEQVVDGRFQTAWVYQAYLEPHIATARPEPTGEIVLEASMQGSFYVRQELARLFDRPLSSIIVEPTPLGGSFGSKLLIAEPLAIGAALAVGRPVRVELTRSEDFLITQPAPATLIEVKVGANPDGRLCALFARILVDTGAFAEWSIDSFVGILLPGPYRWPSYSIESLGVRTNRFPTGAYRAPGGPQTAFAIESLLDELAARLCIDPLRLRLQNLVGEGDSMVDGEPWPPIGLRTCLERAEKQALWRRKDSCPENEGVGLAVGCWPGAQESARATCRLDEDGSLTVITGAVDMSGATSSIAAIAADAAGLPADRIRVAVASTAFAPHSPATGGSGFVYSVGAAVERAGYAVRNQLLHLAAQELEASEDDLEVVDGDVRALDAPSRSISVARLAAKFAGSNAQTEPIEGHAGAAPAGLAPSTAAHLAHVRVDPETGVVQVLGYVLVQDVGRAINPALVEGQMHGAIAQGLGWALLEELVHDQVGNLVTSDFVSYVTPSADFVPTLETVIVEIPSEYGPFGAKGMAEAPVVGVPAAVANAIAAATGARLHELPMTSERIWRELQ